VTQSTSQNSSNDQGTTSQKNTEGGVGEDNSERSTMDKVGGMEKQQCRVVRTAVREKRAVGEKRVVRAAQSRSKHSSVGLAVNSQSAMNNKH
jgi:hypothetical protein